MTDFLLKHGCWWILRLDLKASVSAGLSDISLAEVRGGCHLINATLVEDLVLRRASWTPRGGSFSLTLGEGGAPAPLGPH